MNKFYLFLFGLFLMSANAWSQAAGDNPCTATALTLGTSCSYSTYSMAGATNTGTGIAPAPTCANYSGPDVWFSVVVPASGTIILDTQTGGVTDGGMAIYSGICSGPLTQIACDDDNSSNGLMPAITQTGLTPGATIYIRFWQYGGGTGTFGICATQPGSPNNQDCLNAIPVCQATYSNPTSYSGTGNVPNEINSGISCLGSGEKNDVWYQFTVQTAGQLCFIINPNTNANDYDWAVFNLTSANCSDIATNAALQVACNFSGQTTYTAGSEPAWATPVQNGNTGMLPSGTWNAGNFQMNNCITVSSGQTFVLNVSNFSSSANGYTLTFPPTGTAGMAQIFDNVPPVFQSITTPPSCGATSFTFNFSENILCSTVSAADFTLSGPGGPYTVTGVNGVACTAGAPADNTLSITTTPPVTTAGTYTLCLTNAAGSVTDLCNNVAAAACTNFTITGPSVSTTQVNVNCNGGTNGSITATGSAGSGAPYTYSLNGGAYQASGTFSGLAAGTYTVNVKDVGGCAAQAIVTITQPAVLNITATPTNASCAGNNGSIATTVTGGTAGYTYVWAPSGSGANPTGLNTGTYTVTVTDSKGCTDNATATIAVTGTVTSTFTSGANQCLTGNTYTFTNTGTSAGGPTYSWTFNPSAGAPASSSANNYGPVSFTAAGTYTVSHTVTIGSCTSTTTQNITIYPMPVNPTLTMTATTCGNNNGVVNVTAPTGAGITYSLNGGAFTTTTSYTGLAAGTHTITVKDANGCTSTGTIVITATPPPTAVVLTPTNSTCGNANGSFTIGAVTGGTAAYTYSVNGGAYSATTSYTNQAAATYTISVKDANGCIYTQNVTVANTPGPTALAATSVNSTCGNANGTVNIGATTGGTSPYTYSFNGSPFTSTVSYTGQAAGTYNIIVKDANGCQFTRTITITNTPGPTAVALSSTNASCGSSNGTFTIGAVTGGTAAYTYSVNGGAFTATTSYPGQAAGTYTITVKDANGCTYTQNVVVNNNTGPTAMVLTPVNANCGTASGSFTIGAITGGTAAYTYSVNGGAFTATTSYTSQSAGTYTVTVKDANGCTFTANTTVGNNPGPTAVVLTPTNSTCGASNGSVLIGAVTGGTAAYTYSFNGGAFTATTSYTGLAAGTKTVTVKDANGCTFTQTVVVGNTPGPTAVVLTPTNSTCGNANGSFTIGAVTGGTSAYTYSVNGGAYTSTVSYTGQAAATYTISVKDANGCLYSQNVTVANTPGPTAQAVSNTNSTCGNANGTATIGATTGGTSPYTFSFNGSPFTATTSYTGLAAGTYTVIVKDANGCTFSTTTTIANTPGPTAVVLTPANASCGAANGSFTIGAVTGGTAAYTYSVNGGAFTATTSYPGQSAGTYTITVKDANGCTYTQNVTVNNSSGPTAVVLTPVNATCGSSNGSFTIGAVTGGSAAYTYSVNAGAFTSTTSYTGLAAGTYTVTVKDANGCTYTTTTAISNTGGPTAQAMSSTISACSSNTGTATFGVTTGGTAAYTYSFNGSPFTGTTTYSSLAPGTYTAIVKDANGCQFSTTVTVGVAVGASAVVLTPTNTTCGATNGTVAIGAVTGGTSPYTYSLDGGAFTSTVSYTGLTASTHTVVVKDANGCTYTQTVTIGNTPGPTAVALTSVNSTCGSANGVVNVGAVTGGTAAYTYSIDGGAFTSTVSYTGLTAATHTIVVKDANGCTFTQTIAVANTPGPTAQAVTNTNETCGSANGTVTIGATTGGTAAYTYSFNAGAFSGTTSYTGLAAGTYTVVVKDANGCQFTTTTVVSNVPGPTAVTLTPVNATCGNANGTFTIGAVTGGTSPYTYSVNGSGFTSTTSYSSLAVGTYTVVVKDANGCQFTNTTTINNSGGPTAVVLTPASSTCGNANGTVTIGAVTGGAGSNSYSFNGSGFTSTTSYTGLLAGTYTVVVKDANGCTFTQTTTVTDIPGPTALALTTVNSTCGAANGVVNVGTVTGGTSAYTYSLNGGAFTATTSYTGLSAATYTVVVKDANGCTFTQTVVLSDTPGPTALALTTVNSTCGAANGVVNVGAVTGGTSAYTYSLNGGAFTSTTSYTGLSAATYTVVVKDANGCTFTQTVALADTPGPTAQAFTVVNETCTAANGSVTIGATTGGTAAYTFGFDGSGFTSTTTYSGLAAGTHTIIVKDANGCQFTTTANITNTPGPTALALSSVSANCGGANGSVAVGAVTGGTAAYTYSFNGSPFTGTTSYPGLSPATYTVVVKDANSCTFTQTVTVGNIGAPTASITAQTNVSCNGGSNGAVTVTAAGGAGGYTYTITPGGTSNGTGIFTGLAMGSYTVNITDAASCPVSQTVSITEPTVLTSSVTAQTNVSCNAGNNGSVTVAGAGATPAYTYSLNGGAFGASGTFSTLSAGSYTVTVKDANGCNINQPVTITEPTAVALTVNPIVDANCTASNGHATVNPTGGTPGYTYSWSGSGGSAATTVGLPAGTYTATVTDANGCVKTTTATIGVIPGGTATMSNVNNVTCFGAGNGSLTVSMGGNATGPFTYVWSPNVGTTPTVTGLTPGGYTVTVTDTYGCIATANATITEPIVLNVTLASVNVSCNGGSDGSINTTVTGGTGAVTYLWSPGAFTTANVSNLPIGTYSVTVTDVNGCTATANQTLVQPTALAINPVVTNPHCNQADGSFTVTGSGGAGSYTFSMNNGAFGSGSFGPLAAGTYTVTIKDGNQCTQSFPVQLIDQAGPTATLTGSSNVLCNGGTTGSATVSATGGTGAYTYTWNTSPVQTTPTATNLPQGIYSVDVKDAAGCIASVGVTITEPPALTLNTTFTDPVCSGYSNGTATASAFGGTPNYSYVWGPAPTQSTATATGLAAGAYNVIVTDANGCTQSANVTLTNPPAVTATITPTNLLCFNVCSGSATVNPANGVAPYSFSWNDPNAQTTQTATGLCAGSFTATVTDLHGCIATVTTSLTQPTLLTSNTTSVPQVNVSCAGLCDGSGTASASGGTAPYAYSWNDPSNQATAVASNLCAGSYTVTVTDANGCTSPSPLTITQPNPIILSATKTDASCYGVCDGTATASFSGGTAPYSFLWQNSLATVFNPTGLCAGTQTVTIKDANNCTSTTTVTINEPNQLSVSTSVSNNAFCGQSNGSAQASVTGGTGPFGYLWSNGATTLVNSGLASATYSITVTDANGCQAQSFANVQDIPGPLITINSVTDITCYNLHNGSVTSSISGGTPGYTVTWLLPNLNPNPTQTGDSLYPGYNTIHVVDAAGCVRDTSIQINEPTQLNTAIPQVSVTNANCNGSLDGNATMLVNGGTPGYTYLWTDPSAQTTATAVSLGAGTYTCTVTDANGCQASKPVTITEPLPIIINVNTIAQVVCYNDNNGQINVTPSGGTPGYTYSWSPNVGSGPVVTNLSGATLPGSTTYGLQVTDNHGCTATASYNISQPDSFKVISNFTPSTCSNSNGTVSVVVSGASSPFGYSWNDQNNQQTATATGLPGSVNPPTPYTCVITDAHGCITSATINLVDQPGPTIDSTTAVNVTCNGFNNGVVTVYPKGGTPGFTYTWTNASSVVVGNTLSVPGVTAGTYNILVTDANNCTMISTVVVTQPQPITLTNSPNMTACNGQTLGVYAAAGGGTLPYHFTWAGAGTGLVGGGNHNIVYHNTTSASIVQSYSVSVTDTNNCPAVSGQFNVTVLPKISITPTNVTACNGDMTTLQAGASGGDGAPYQFTWSTGSSNTGTTSSIVVPANINQSPQTFTVTVDDGCSTTEDTTLTLTVNPNPIAGILGVNLSGCTDLAVNFAGSNGGVTGSTFEWSFGDNTTSTSQNPSHVYTNATSTNQVFNVQLIVTSPLGCKDTALNVGYVTVYPKPLALFSSSPGSTTSLYPEINFINASQGAVSYAWDFGDPSSNSNTSSLLDPTHYYEEPGSYTINLTATSAQGCVDDAQETIVVEPDYALYVPNAFSPNGDSRNEVFLPKGIGIDESKYNLFIFNRWGELVFQSNNFDTGWDGKDKGGAPAQEDVYVWKIVAFDLNNNKHNLVGHVTVVR